jgi:hypothetical protein
MRPGICLLTAIRRAGAAPARTDYAVPLA